MIINDISTQHSAWVFYGVLLGTMLLLRIPHVGTFLRSITTLIHEMAHAIMALIVGGTAGHMEIHEDRSGSIKTTVKSKFGRILVSLSGYILTALFVLMAFFLIKIEYYNWILVLLLIIALLGLLFFIRNAFGIIWLIAFCTANIILLSYGSTNLKMWTTLIITIVIFAESILSTFELMFIVVINPSQGGDAKNLANEIKIPAFLWALFILVVVSYISYVTIIEYFPYGTIIKIV